VAYAILDSPAIHGVHVIVASGWSPSGAARGWPRRARWRQANSAAWSGPSGLERGDRAFVQGADAAVSTVGENLDIDAMAAVLPRPKRRVAPMCSLPETDPLPRRTHTVIARQFRAEERLPADSDHGECLGESGGEFEHDRLTGKLQVDRRDSGLLLDGCRTAERLVHRDL
jgi:hypothetical protein